MKIQPTPIPSNLNTIQKDQPDQGNQTPTLNGLRGIQRGERVIEGRVRDERKTQPNQRELDHHSQRTERGSERTERGVIWVNQDGLERGIGLWEEWGVLRLGMVSEGGEYGS
jgi:hypothetical protein